MTKDILLLTQRLLTGHRFWWPGARCHWGRGGCSLVPRPDPPRRPSHALPERGRFEHHLGLARISVINHQRVHLVAQRTCTCFGRDEHRMIEWILGLVRLELQDRLQLNATICRHAELLHCLNRGLPRSLREHVGKNGSQPEQHAYVRVRLFADVVIDALLLLLVDAL